MSDPTMDECWERTHIGPCGVNCVTNIPVDRLVYLLRMKTYNEPATRKKIIQLFMEDM